MTKQYQVADFGSAFLDVCCEVMAFAFRGEDELGFLPVSTQSRQIGAGYYGRHLLTVNENILLLGIHHLYDADECGFTLRLRFDCLLGGAADEQQRGDQQEDQRFHERDQREAV